MDCGLGVPASNRCSVQRHNSDMRYENPLYLTEEAAALDLIADGYTALDEVVAE